MKGERQKKDEGIAERFSLAKHLFLALGILIFFMFWLLPDMNITGFVTLVNEFEYSDRLDLELNSSYNHTLIVEGELQSVRLDGSLSEGSSAQVYLDAGDDSYLIFDSSGLSSEGISGITGFAVGDLVEDTTALREVLPEKAIVVSIDGGGSKTLKSIFEFAVSTRYTWDVDESMVCTMWKVNGDAAGCYGSSACCDLVGLEAVGDWDDHFYLSYGRYESGLDNTVTAQVVYADYLLTANHAHSDIVYSSVVEVGAEFYDARIEFSDACWDTCLLGLNASTYTLRFVVNGSL